MNKIVVVGPSGAGKSEFSRKLNKILNIPLYHLDNIFWNKDKTHIEREEFDCKLNDILYKERWIIDGDYSRTYEIRFKNADTIFFLDYPKDICIEGANSRIGKKRDDLPWIEEEFDNEFKEWIINWFNETKPVLLDLINKYKNEKRIIVFKSREETIDYINNLLK